MNAIPLPLGLLIGLVVLLAIVLTIYWFFMAKNNPSAQKVDELPPHNEEHRLHDQYERGELSEEDYNRKLQDLENASKHS